MKQWGRIVGAVGFFVLAIGVSAQQETCPTIVEQAVATTDSACGDTGRNQACYGHIILDAELAPDITDMTMHPVDPGFVFTLPNSLSACDKPVIL